MIVDLTVRAIEERDFPACLALLRARAAYPDGILPDVREVWRRLLRDDAMVASAVEVRGAAGESSIAAFGLSVFVDEAWAAGIRLGQEPYVTARTIRAEIDGRSPILRPAAVARNGAGLSILILHYGEAPDLPPELRMAVRYRMFESLIHTHRGYRIDEILQEFWDEIDPEFIERGWGRIISRYDTYYARRGALPPAGPGPRLVAVTRADVAAHPGAIAAPLFVYTPPRLSFTAAERALLGQAMLGATDAELTARLGLALPTVKSRWRAIYDRVGRVAPEILGDPAPLDAARPARGQEKRRVLLEYIRRHPEELRPVANQRRRAPSRRTGDTSLLALLRPKNDIAL